MKILYFLILAPLMVFGHSNWKNPFLKEDPTLKASMRLFHYHKQMQMLHDMNVDIAGVDIKKRIVDVLITDGEFETLNKMGFRPVITEARGVSEAARIDEKFKNPQEIEEYLKRVSQRYPKITKLFILGKSTEGRNIYALKISDNPEIEEPQEPAILFNAMHHAREIMTPEVPIDIIESLISNYMRRNRVAKHWIDDNETWIVPMLNVDGNAKVWASRPMWRKNTFGGHGVDLNRNYPEAWGTCNGSSGSKWSDTYRGASPGSEKETQVLMNLVKKIRPVFNISFHSYSNLVLYPMGCRGVRTQTAEVVEKIGKEMAKLNGYTPGTGWELLYSTDGGDIDWMYKAMQVIPYVFELTARNVGFHPDYDKYRDKTVKENRGAWQHLFKRLYGPGVRGMITDKGTGKPLGFKVDIIKGAGSNKARNVWYTYRGNPDGSYFIILNPGNYTLNYTLADGRTFNKAVQVKDRQVNLTFEL